MIPQIIWPQDKSSFVPNSFHSTSNHLLLLTFHSSSLVNLFTEEEAALTILRNLCNLPELDGMEIKFGEFFDISPSYSALKELLEVDQGTPPHFLIGTFDPKSEYLPVASKRKNGDIGIGRVPYPNELLKISCFLVGQENPDHPDVKNFLTDFIAARAHFEFRRHIFVTKSPGLLAYRTDQHVEITNPSTPLETIQIVGLFFRSFNKYPYKVSKDSVA